MATDEVLRGPTGETVRENVLRLRTKRKLSLRALAARTEELNRPLGHGSINQIEQGRRRVDVDDLMTLAVALHVSPLALLFPYTTERYEHARVAPVEATGVGATRLGVLWSWGKGIFRPSWIQVPGEEWDESDENGVAAAEHEDGVFVVPQEVSQMMTQVRKMDQRRKERLFDLFDLYFEEYRKDRQEMRVENGNG